MACNTGGIGGSDCAAGNNRDFSQIDRRGRQVGDIAERIDISQGFFNAGRVNAPIKHRLAPGVLRRQVQSLNQVCSRIVIAIGCCVTDVNFHGKLYALAISAVSLLFLSMKSDRNSCSPFWNICFMSAPASRFMVSVAVS